MIERPYSTSLLLGLGSQKEPDRARLGDYGCTRNHPSPQVQSRSAVPSPTREGDAEGAGLATIACGSVLGGGPPDT